ncbi:MAG: protein translocase subunit SecF [Alphaproteobacteria bacterium]|nr:protein translocase subunit SecF [Alphaproteobacteria bacterium]
MMKLHFMKYRKLSYWISAICVALSIISIVFKGFNYGIDFSGGISMEVQPVSADYTVDKMRHDLAQFKPELQAVDGNSVLIRVGLPKGSTDEEQNVRVAEIKNILGNRVTYSQIQVVGPKIGGELIRGGILAILVSFVMMAVYIWVRYRGGYAVGSFVSLIFDLILMFGFFSAVGLEFNQTAIAVILMGVGYSVNDKVVNYDRIDENIKKYHKMPISDIIDLSVNEMLYRTIMTSVSTILAMVGIYMFGGQMLREFAVAMTFSIVSGTLTSIYISNVILYHFNLRETEY